MTLQSPKPRGRGLKGGLDNAIRQAEERGFYKMQIIDSDCHQMEPFLDFAKYCEEPYKTMLLARDPEADPWFAKRLKSQVQPFGPKMQTQHAMKGIRFLKRPETTYPSFQQPKELIDVFANLMHDIGIKRSVIFPTTLLGLPESQAKFEVGIAKGYMSYMLDNFLGKYPEILTTIYVPTNDPQRAAELIDDIGSEKGIVGVMISGGARTLAGSDDLDPIYQAAQKKGLPICFHSHLSVGSYPLGLEAMPFIGYHALSFPLSIIRHFVSVVVSGLPVRYPNLRFIFIEGGITWIPWLMNRLDDEYTKRKLEAPLLSKLPSEYMREFYYTSQPLEQAHKEDLEFYFNKINAEKHLLYASDYPHWDFDVPSVIYDLPFLSSTAKKNILGENAMKLFRLN